MMKNHRPSIATTVRRSGFALVITLSLMILLTLLAVGLLSLSAVSLRASKAGEDMAIARYNARLAVLMAIGDLQKTLGGDKAVTAPSDIASEKSGKPHLTGVWESWDFNPNTSALNYSGEKQDRFRKWLVSGADPKELATEQFGAAGWKGATVELVGRGTLGERLDDRQRTYAGLVPVTTGDKSGGAVAWMVSDESCKVRINSYRKPVEKADTLARRRAALGGHRPNVWEMESPQGASLAFLPRDIDTANPLKAYQKAEETVGRVLDLSQAELLSEKGVQAGAFWHDATPYSLGVLADVRHGGLKQDLSSVFEMSPSLPAEFTGRQLYRSTHGITGVSDPNWSALSAYYNVFRSLTNANGSPTYSKRPSDQVEVPNIGNGYRQPQLPRSFHPGPVIAKIETIFTLVTRDSHANWVNSLRAIDPEMKYMGHLVYTPLVTLHNPYNINISFDAMEVIIRNPPVAFAFYVNGVPQSSRLVPLTDMFVYGADRGEKSFALNIANWTSPTSTSPSGPIIMKPGQTLVCGPYLDPGASFENTKGTPFFDWQNNLTGYRDQGGSVMVNPIKAKPGFAGRCVGFDVDWITPTHNGLSSGQQTDRAANGVEQGVLGIRTNDTIHWECALGQPSLGLNTEFQVSAKLTVSGAQVNYGGLVFRYEDDTTLKRVNNRTYRYPRTGAVSRLETYVPNTTGLAAHGFQAKSFALFSAYARTCNGGVYETGRRTETAGALNALRDGRLASMPFLFHNSARTVSTVNLRGEKPSSCSHELNFQPLNGNTDDTFEIDGSNRTRSLMGNTTLKGIKSGSFLELPSGPMQTIADFRRSNALTTPFLPASVQPVANSLVTPLMPTTKVVHSDRAIASYALLDHSVLANHALYDRFYFSTVATDGTLTPDKVFEGFMQQGARLPNQNLVPYLPPGTTADTAKAELFAGTRPNATAYQNTALYQLVRGPFNVNSTSVQAWKAMLSSLSKNDLNVLWVRTAALEAVTSKSIPVPAMTLHNAGAAQGGWNPATVDDTRTNSFNGYRELSDTQVTELARRIVEQVRTRGPFLSLSEFVNRRIGSESQATISGALDVAITKAGINNQQFADLVPLDGVSYADANLYKYNTPAAAFGNPAAGAPGWVTQGDLMRILEPAATVRGDTFVIRACGEARDAKGKVTARAYAEAVVQRLPEYLDPIDKPSVNAYTDPKAALTNKLFGRRMSMIAFRWLSAEEI